MTPPGRPWQRGLVKCSSSELTKRRGAVPEAPSPRLGTLSAALGAVQDLRFSGLPLRKAESCCLIRSVRPEEHGQFSYQEYKAFEAHIGNPCRGWKGVEGRRKKRHDVVRVELALQSFSEVL